MRKNDDRLKVLQSLAILDTAPELVFDDLTRAVAQTFGVPITMVNLLDADRDWFKSCVGLPMTESPASTSFCEVFLNFNHEMLVVEDTLLDARFASHPLVVGPPHIRFYAAARLQVSGQTVGTLCAYDTCVKHVSSKQVEELKALSDAAMELLARRASLPKEN
jgi:GAF domain-containing protein